MLDEYALRFYALLEQSIKLDAGEWLQYAVVYSIPQMEEVDKKQAIEKYEKAIYDIVEDVRNSKNADKTGKLKELFNG